jgi:SPP1 family predicted phage head-tail adaptor
MQAGRLNRRCQLQSPSQSVDELGQPIPGWTDVALVWASIRHLSGVEAIKADAVTSTVKASIRIRYRTGLNAGMRVVHGAQVYSIEAVMPDVGGREFVDLVAEVVA